MLETVFNPGDFEHGVDHGDHVGAILRDVGDGVAVAGEVARTADRDFRNRADAGQRRAEIVRDIVRHIPQFGEQMLRIRRHGVEDGNEGVDLRAVVLEGDALGEVPRGNLLCGDADPADARNETPCDQPPADDARQENAARHHPEQQGELLQIFADLTRGMPDLNGRAIVQGSGNDAESPVDRFEVDERRGFHALKRNAEEFHV